MSAEDDLIADVASYSRDPLGYAHYAFPWAEEGELAAFAGPHPWQAEILDAIGQHLRGPKWQDPIRIAVSSGRGIGKSALISMLSQWAMATCDDCRVVVTANTEPQLATKTWPEISKWFRRAINSHWWVNTATKICSADKRHADTWRIDRETWSENNVEAFRGLHNSGKRMVIIFDEAAGIPTPIWQATEGSLTDEGTEMIWVAFSNPSQTTGSFRECFGRFKHRWLHKTIDSRTVPGTNKEEIERWRVDYGEDSDYFRVNVKGEFPRAGSGQLIPSDLVQDARKRELQESAYVGHWRVLVCDVARYGDDQTVVGYRQGPLFKVTDKCRFDEFIVGPNGQKQNSTVQTANRVIMRMKELDPRTVVIDGDGIGGGVVDYIRESDYGIAWLKANPARRIMEFHGGSGPTDANMYFNFRASMWGAMKSWLQGGQIPDDPELESDLTGPQYFFSNKNQIQLEKKEDMKKRGLASPDLGDCLAMSFCAIIAGKTQEERDREQVEATKDVQQRNLVQYKLTMEREAQTRRAEERRPDHWD